MPKPTKRPLDVFSSGNSGLVMPISLRYASAENDSRLRCWFFQPKRPTPMALLPSSAGTMTAVPRISAGCASRSASSVSLATHSMKPLPSVLVEMRNVRTSSSNATRSTIVRVRGARVDQRAAERFEEAAGRVHPPGAMLGDLARAAGHDVLVAFGAALRVVRRTEAVRDHFDFLEDEAVVVERAVRHDVVFVERVVRRPLLQEAVGTVVEAGGRLAEEIRLRDRVGRLLYRHHSRMLKAVRRAVVGCRVEAQ